MPESVSNDRKRDVETFVQSKKVAIFMKGLPEAPQCGFSAHACAVLRAAGVAPEDLAAFDVLSDDPMWDALEAYTQWPTVPQIFVRGQFVGGCDLLTEMYEQGELQKLLGS